MGQSVSCVKLVLARLGVIGTVVERGCSEVGTSVGGVTHTLCQRYRRLVNLTRTSPSERRFEKKNCEILERKYLVNL
jgi:hypothetical protein